MSGAPERVHRTSRRGHCTSRYPQQVGVAVVGERVVEQVPSWPALEAAASEVDDVALRHFARVRRGVAHQREHSRHPGDLLVGPDPITSLRRRRHREEGCPHLGLEGAKLLSAALGPGPHGAGPEAVDAHDPGGRLVRAVPGADEPAERMPDDVDRPQLQMVGQRGDVARGVTQAEARRVSGLAAGADVQGHRATRAPEACGPLLHGDQVRAAAVEQHEASPVAPVVPVGERRPIRRDKVPVSRLVHAVIMHHGTRRRGLPVARTRTGRAPSAWRCGVSDGVRTRDNRDHNLAELARMSDAVSITPCTKGFS